MKLLGPDAAPLVLSLRCSISNLDGNSGDGHLCQTAYSDGSHSTDMTPPRCLESGAALSTTPAADTTRSLFDTELDCSQRTAAGWSYDRSFHQPMNTRITCLAGLGISGHSEHQTFQLVQNPWMSSLWSVSDFQRRIFVS